MIRQALLDNAVAIALEHGMKAVTVQAVAQKTGVTKGGFFHHFPTKEALDDAVFGYLLEGFIADITERMSKDDEPHGRFTRAYIEAAFVEDDGNAALWLSSLNNEKCKTAWAKWYAQQLRKYKAHECGAKLEAARLSADGIWLARIVSIPIVNAKSLRQYLLSLTKPT